MQIGNYYQNSFTTVILLQPNHKIPPFYKDMHMLFMIYFKLDPVNLMNILTQSLCLNNNVTTNKELLYWKTWEDQGIARLKYILNKYNLYLKHEE